MGTNTFFNESSDASRIKTSIVSKYFWAWAKVIIPTAKKHGQNIAYIDLFAGPGRYEDGTKSTPVMILEKAAADRDMQGMLVTVFNDLDPKKTDSLQDAISAIPGIDKLTHRPLVTNQVVGEEIARTFERIKLVPTLFFVDPWGYRGLSLKLVQSVLKDWGCDCIFFFNYNRINMGLGNELVEEHMNALFGKARADRLRERLLGIEPQDREQIIVDELVKALLELGGKFVLPFTFTNESGSRTSHQLIFVTKHPKGCQIMKEIMDKVSSDRQQGVPSFAFNPAQARQPTLFKDIERPLDALAESLLADFAGRRMTVRQIIDTHRDSARYLERNFKEALRRLEEQGRIEATPPAYARPSRGGEVTIGPKVEITFPRRPT